MIQEFNSGDIAVIIDASHKHHGRLVHVCGMMKDGDLKGQHRVCLMQPRNDSGLSGSDDLFLWFNQMMKVPEEDLALCQRDQEDTVAGDGIVIDLNFIEKYLSDSQIRDICSRVLEKKITSTVEEILSTQRRYLGKNEMDLVFEKIAKTYAEKFEDRYADTMVKKFEEIIQDEKMKKDYDGEYVSPFWKHVQSYLESYASDYIQKNPDQIRDLIWPQVEKAGTSVSQYTLETAIKKSIDIDGILKNLIQASKAQESADKQDGT